MNVNKFMFVQKLLHVDTTPSNCMLDYENNKKTLFHWNHLEHKQQVLWADEGIIWSCRGTPNDNANKNVRVL